MRCPYCIEEGERSRVTVGNQVSTLAAVRTTYDEDGQLVRAPDPNMHTTSYECSRGHRWIDKTCGGHLVSREQFPPKGPRIHLRATDA